LTLGIKGKLAQTLTVTHHRTQLIMAVPSFYQPSLRPDDQLVSLEANEAAHAIKSRRLRAGEAVRLFNGTGLVAHGELSVVERREVTVKVSSFEQCARPASSVSIAVALPKGDRQKVMVDMLTQLGVFEIIPLRCERSITKFGVNTREKWLRASIEACKQSQNPYLPVISEELGIDELLANTQRNFAYANADGVVVKSVIQQLTNLTVLIGPEGGFASAEFAQFNEYSIPAIKVGEYILRTEAAAIAVASALAV